MIYNLSLYKYVGLVIFCHIISYLQKMMILEKITKTAHVLDVTVMTVSPAK